MAEDEEEKSKKVESRGCQVRMEAEERSILHWGMQRAAGHGSIAKEQSR